MRMLKPLQRRTRMPSQRRISTLGGSVTVIARKTPA